MKLLKVSICLMFLCFYVFVVVVVVVVVVVAAAAAVVVLDGFHDMDAFVGGLAEDMLRVEQLVNCLLILLAISFFV